MLKLFFWTASLASLSVAQTRSVSYPSMDPCRAGGCLAPVFDKGYFFQLKDYRGAARDGYALWDAEGKPVYEITITAPDGSPGNLRQDAAIDSDGSAAVPMTVGKPVVKGGIALVDALGNQTKFIDTARWLPVG